MALPLGCHQGVAVHRHQEGERNPVMTDDIMPRSMAISLLCSSIFGALFWAALILLAFPNGVRLPAGLYLSNLFARIDGQAFQEPTAISAIGVEQSCGAPGKLASGASLLPG